MTPCQIVRRTIDFTGPERLAFDHFAHAGRYTDIVTAYLDWDFEYERRAWKEGGYEYYLDPLGNTWWRMADDQATKGELYRGLLQESWDGLERFQMAPLSRAASCPAVRDLFAAYPDHFKVGCLYYGAFSALTFLRSFTNLMEDLVCEPQRVRAASDLIVDELVKAVSAYADCGADGIHIMEDWGSQTSAFISRPMWEDLFAPGYQRICTEARRRDMRVLLHSCGMNRELIPGFIASGIDVLQFDQTANYRTPGRDDGIERLAAEFAGQVTFFCPVDIQHTLATRDRRRIDDEARRMVTLLGSRQGGFIAKSYGRGAQVYLDALNVDAETNDFAFECFRRHGEALFGSQFEIPHLPPTAAPTVAAVE